MQLWAWRGRHRRGVSGRAPSNVLRHRLEAAVFD